MSDNHIEVIEQRNIVEIASVGVQGPAGPTGPTGATGPTGPAAAYAQDDMPTGAVDGSVWLDTNGTSTAVFEQRWRKVYSSGTTTITGVDDNGLTLAYTVGYEKVYLNGVLLVQGSDYTASNGTSVVLTATLTTGDVVDIITTSTFTAANTLTTAQINTLAQDGVIADIMDIY